jgi:HEAT repeat protein/glucose/arabinose dehydrogenase
MCHGSAGGRDSLSAAPPVEFNPPAIEVPDDFTLELVAGPPLVKHPMLAAFDDRGRLFVAETDGVNLHKEELLKSRNRFIRMLEDTDDDGKFDKSTIFADKMIMPEGALWHDGALYVISAPYLWRLEDTDDDGVADKREKLVGKFDFNGNPNLTGPYLGPCGRIYFTGGAFGYDLEDAGGRRLGKSSAASVFSCRADGTDLQIFGQGTINPVEVIFTPAGELFTTVAIFDNIGGRHDALMHWVDGCLSNQVWGKPLLPQTGYPLPAVCRWGQVAPAGLMRYRNKALSKDFHNNIFACQFNTHQVMRVELERRGASFLPKKDEPFITSSAIDFHPTDIFEDADGSLLLIDTGGWLYYGCPTSKIAKPKIYGAIYRLRQKGMKLVDDPRGNRIDWASTPGEEMVGWLGDPRPVVRDRAIDTLARRGNAAVDALSAVIQQTPREQAWTVQMRRNAVWSLSRIGTEKARVALREALLDDDSTVRQAAVRSLGILGDHAARDVVCDLLLTDEPPVRRAAATALSKLASEDSAESATSVNALLEGISQADNDRYLMHAQIYALIRLGNFDATLAGLGADNTQVRRSALIALDQMANSRLTYDMVIPLLNTSDQLLRTTAIEIITKHKDWADKIAQVAAGWLNGRTLSKEDAALALAVLKTYAGDQGIQPMMATTLARNETPRETKLLIIDALAESNLEAMPDAFVEPLKVLLGGGDTDVLERSVAALSIKDTDKLDPQLLELAREEVYKVPLRLAALAIVARHSGSLQDADFNLLVDQFNEEIGRASCRERVWLKV